MTFLERIAECRAHDRERFVPLAIEERPAGRVRRDIAAALLEHDDVFERHGEGLRLSPRLLDFEARTAAVDGVVDGLVRRGLMRRLGHEWYPIAPSFGSPPWLAVERSALPAFGMRAHGVHLHGYVRRADGLHLWIARRARDRATFPGQLDNMVAGGQPLGLSVRENLQKECAEEASVPPALAARAVPTGALHYRVDHAWGVRDDVLFLFDLELPDDFVPRNADGEVESFELLPVVRVAELVATTRQFKFNCNLTLLDFFVRHGVVGPEHDDYLAVLAGLHGWDAP